MQRYKKEKKTVLFHFFKVHQREDIKLRAYFFYKFKLFSIFLRQQEKKKNTKSEISGLQAYKKKHVV